MAPTSTSAAAVAAGTALLVGLYAGRVLTLWGIARDKRASERSRASAARWAAARRTATLLVGSALVGGAVALVLARRRSALGAPSSRDVLLVASPASST